MFVKSKVIIDLDADPTQIQKIEFTGYLKNVDIVNRDGAQNILALMILE